MLLLQYLGSQGARLEDVDAAQRTALHWATEYGRAQVGRQAESEGLLNEGEPPPAPAAAAASFRVARK